MTSRLDVGAGVDVIILVQIPANYAAETKEKYASLLTTLQDGGLKAVGRRGDSDGKILVFVSCPEAALNVLIHKARLVLCLAQVFSVLTPLAEKSTFCLVSL